MTIMKIKELVCMLKFRKYQKFFFSSRRRHTSLVSDWSSTCALPIYLRDEKLGADLYEKIMAAGESYKIAPTGPSQIRRVEAGIFSYFQDMRVTDNPYEIGMDRLVDLDLEADFWGKRSEERRVGVECVARWAPQH